jgi:hypothetical protein
LGPVFNPFRTDGISSLFENPLDQGGVGLKVLDVQDAQALVIFH